MKWENPVLESLTKRITNGQAICLAGSLPSGNCVLGDTLAGGIGNCNSGVVANGCTVGAIPSPI